jgi:hypothetical protein
MKITVQRAAQELYDRFSGSEAIQFTFGWDVGSEKTIRVFTMVGGQIHNVPATFRGYRVSVEPAPQIKAFGDTPTGCHATMERRSRGTASCDTISQGMRRAKDLPRIIIPESLLAK